MVFAALLASVPPHCTANPSGLVSKTLLLQLVGNEGFVKGDTFP